LRLPALLTLACLCVRAHDSRAEPAPTLFHVTHDTYGCVNPRATPAITNLADPRQRDLGWVHFVITDGQCVTITRRSAWRLVFRQDDIAYMTYAGTTGPPGSYYLKFSDLVEIPATHVTTPPSASAPPPENQAANGSPPDWAASLTASQSTVATQSLTPVHPNVLPAPRQSDPGASARALITNGYIDPPESRVQPSAPVAALPAPYASPPPQTAGQERTQTQGSSSGGVVVPILLAVGVAGFLLRKAKKSAKPRTRVEPRAKVQPKQAVPAVKVQVSPVSPNRGGSLATWYPKGNTVTVAGHVIRDGLVYVGGQHPSAPSGSPCFIDPSLAVARSGPDTGGSEMSYWPSYAQITPRGRLAYLQWLANGKFDPAAYIGFVFLYFYGLERRVFVAGSDPSETAIIAAEVERLRRIYSSNRSFDGYSRGFLEAVEIKRLLSGPALPDEYVPDLGAPPHTMPVSLKLAIATRVARNEPLPFDLAIAGLLGLPQGILPVDRRVLNHARPQLLGMLRPRFEAACPLGFRLPSTKDSKLPLVYCGATAGLQVDMGTSGTGASLPDPTTLSWTKLIALVVPVAEELEAYAKRVAHRPTWSASLEAVAALPQEVRASVATATAKTACRWLRSLSSPLAEVSFAELAQHVLGEAGASWTARRQEKATDALAALSYGTEPSLLPDAPPLTGETVVILFPDADPKAPRSPSFKAAMASAGIVSAVARLDPVARPSVENAWFEAIAARLSLPPTEQLQLLARLRWLARTEITIPRVRKFLSVTTPGDKEIIGWSTATAAGALGIVAPDQMSLLERIYDGLSLPRHDLYAALHRGAVTAAAPSPRPTAATTPSEISGAGPASGNLSQTLAPSETANTSSDAPTVAATSTGKFGRQVSSGPYVAREPVLTPQQVVATVANRGLPFDGKLPKEEPCVTQIAARGSLAAGPDTKPSRPDDEPVLVASGTGEVVHSIPAPPLAIRQPTAAEPPSIAAPDADKNQAEKSVIGIAVVPPAQPPVSPDAGQDPHEKPTDAPRRPEPALLDEERVRQIRAETERVMSLLQNVFAEEEEPAAAAAPVVAAGDFPGLDGVHTKLVHRLATQPNWPRSDFDREATASGLLPDGALETINEWAFDHLGDALIDDGEPLSVNLELLSVFQGIADAA
jgi:TerB N-terminal domain/TerB-C domain